VVKISSLSEPYYAEQNSGGRRVAELADPAPAPAAPAAAPAQEPASVEPQPLSAGTGAFPAPADPAPAPINTVQILPAAQPADPAESDDTPNVA
jgi:hypothetical protein